MAPNLAKSTLMFIHGKLTTSQMAKATVAGTLTQIIQTKVLITP